MLLILECFQNRPHPCPDSFKVIKHLPTNVEKEKEIQYYCQCVCILFFLFCDVFWQSVFQINQFSCKGTLNYWKLWLLFQPVLWLELNMVALISLLYKLRSPFYCSRWLWYRWSREGWRKQWWWWWWVWLGNWTAAAIIFSGFSCSFYIFILHNNMSMFLIV